MSSLVLLRWIVPAGSTSQSSRTLIRTHVAPALREGGWLYSPGSTHHLSDEGVAVWVTVIAALDDAPAVKEELTDVLGGPPAVETGDHVLLAPAAAWYRTTLQCVTHVGLDILDADGVIPLSEYEAFADPAEAAPRLAPFLNEVSETYRRRCSSYGPTERFWLDFFRSGPATDLSRAGERLWNLAG